MTQTDKGHNISKAPDEVVGVRQLPRPVTDIRGWLWTSPQKQAPDFTTHNWPDAPTLQVANPREQSHAGVLAGPAHNFSQSHC